MSKNHMHQWFQTFFLQFFSRWLFKTASRTAARPPRSSPPCACRRRRARGNSTLCRWQVGSSGRKIRFWNDKKVIKAKRWFLKNDKDRGDIWQVLKLVWDRWINMIGPLGAMPYGSFDHPSPVDELSWGMQDLVPLPGSQERASKTEECLEKWPGHDWLRVTGLEWTSIGWLTWISAFGFDCDFGVLDCKPLLLDDSSGQTFGMLLVQEKSDP